MSQLDRADPAATRRRDEVFGDVLPDTTRDEAADPRAGDLEPAEDERWYVENRPPHHDRD